jgi:FkbH-like protein
LVLDFDNTIWGGLVGEVGGNGIEIGNGSPAGEIYLRFQKYVIDLNKRGIILAGCTKNEYSSAISGLKNKNNVLKEDHFSVIKANWKNKAENIREIAKDLNIGLDSMVFMDDSKFERELVKKELPMVEVPELGEDPEKFIHFLDNEKYFETTKILKEDKKRISFYKENIKREKEKNSFSDTKGYLESLKMKANFKNFKDSDIERIYQLINKTNQFNLTTYRYTLKDVIKFKKSKKHICIAANLSDKFGDNGLITILIAKIENNKAEILIWLMSCRVFSRDMELAMFDKLIETLLSKKIKFIYGKYLKTKKNIIVKDLFKNLGFKKDKNKWKYEIKSSYKNKNLVIESIND